LVIVGFGYTAILKELVYNITFSVIATDPLELVVSAVD
jgi:hypothetical protein